MGGATTPKIRFDGFSAEWEYENLSTIGSFSRGSGYSKSDLQTDGTPIVLYGRLYTQYETEIKNLDTFVQAKSGSVYSTGREVLIPASGETAEDIARASHIAKSDVLLGGDLNILLPNLDFDPNFVAISISNGETQKSLSKKAQGKSVVHIHNDDIQSISSYFPELLEQISITKLLLNIDEQMKQRNIKVEKLKKLKITFLNKMIPHTHTRIPQIRFKEFAGEWKCVELGDLCSITTGSLDANTETPNGKYAFFTCNKNPSKTDTFAFDGDAILVAGNGNVGHTNIYSGKFNAYQRTYVLMDFSENYLFTKLIIDKYLPEKLSSEVFGGCIPYIKLDTLKKLKVMLP